MWVFYLYNNCKEFIGVGEWKMFRMKMGSKFKYVDFWVKNVLGWFEEIEGGELWRLVMGSVVSLN